MRVFLSLVLAMLSVQLSAGQAAEEKIPAGEMSTYYFIRHAEKDTSDTREKDPELTELGRQRAERWAEVLREVPFDFIYSTEYKRTRQTAAPIARTKKLPVQLYDPAKLNDEIFQSSTKGKQVLVVGHSNTNPQFVNALLGENKYQDIDETESGSLFIVNVSPEGEVSCQLLYVN